MIYNPFTLRVNATSHDDILLLLQPQFFMQMAFLSFKPQYQHVYSPHCFQHVFCCTA